MADIPIYQENPSFQQNIIVAPPVRRVGAKKPYSLASEQGMINAGGALERLGQQFGNRIIDAEFQNDKAEFDGMVNQATTEFESYVASNPGAPYEELNKQRDKMLSSLEKAGMGFSNRYSQQYAKNYMTRNKEAIRLSTDGTIGRIKAHRELGRMNDQVKIFIENRDIEGLKEYLGSHSGNLLPAEDAGIMYEAAFAEIQRLNMKDALQADVVNIANEGGWSESLKWLSDPKTVKTLRDKYGLDTETIDKELENVRTFATTQQAVDKQIMEQATEASKARVHKVVQLPSVDEFLAEWPKERVRINKDPALSTDQKEEELKKGDDRMLALSLGKPDPLDKFDPVVFRKLDRLISTNPENVKETDITGANLTTSQMDSLIKKLNDKRPKTASNNKIFEAYVDMLRGRIIKKKGLLDPFGEEDEIREDLANQAEIEFRERFMDGEWEVKELGPSLDEIMRKYPSDRDTVRNLTIQRRLSETENRDEQRKILLDQMREYKNSGDIQAAKDLAEKALEMGVFSQEELDSGTTEKKKEEKNKISLFKRIWESL